MLAIQYLINASGTLIYPTTIQESAINAQNTPPSYNQITLIFYTGIVTNSNGTISPTGAVTTGLAGTITLQARTTPDSAWSNIQNGSLDISTGANMAFPTGAIQSINAICAGVTGCNYILIQMYRGA